MTPFAFFFRHAAFSYGANETPLQGRRRCAKSLADAEKRALADGCSFEWTEDEQDSSMWSDEQPSYAQFVCTAYDGDGEKFASLSGVDFGRNGTPHDGNPYRRVVEAELACELDRGRP